MVVYNFKKIRPVPSSQDFIDIVLSRTQRKTPTVVHPGYSIGRIRAFYMRKVKYTQESYAEKLGWILEDFPKLDDIHPFYADLCNVLYDRDHYKLALGQLNVAKNLIANISKDYVRLLKYGDSLYRCKQLKRAALGRMCTIMKKHKSSLGYLEEVRKHLSRLPSIDPNTRTLLITGYPNVGKSSFMNKISRADVEVQPYAFTTKSLFVGHFDYKYLRWQLIDTPGILDKPLDERNTIEMQAITALAHLQCCVLYFVDLSEQCGWSLEQQAALFDNIRPLFANKPLIIVANKIDVVPFDSLSDEHRGILDKMAKDTGAKVLPMSSLAELGITDVKRTACERLLEKRIEKKLKSKKVGGVMNRLTVAVPRSRDSKTRPVNIPASVLRAREAKLKKAQGNDGEDAEMEEPKRKTERDLMWENGGPGVYSADYKKLYLLKNDEHKYDVIPEIMDGKNIADFVDPDIMLKLKQLEEEEEQLVRRDDAEMDYESDLDEEEKEVVGAIRTKKKMVVAAHRTEKGKNRSVLPKKHKKTNAAKFKESMAKIGYDTATVQPKVAHGKKRKRNLVDMDVDEEQRKKPKQKSFDRIGLRDEAQVAQARKQMRKSMRSLEQQGRAGEADRHITTKLPKHLFAGKRKMGKTNRR